MRDRFIRYRKNPAKALSTPAVIPNNNRMPQLAPIAIGEFGSPKQTGHAHDNRGVASIVATTATSVRMPRWVIALAAVSDSGH